MGPPLVGRSAERAALADALAGPASGRGALVLLTGSAGMGKTALAAAAADACPVPTLWGGAWEGGGAPAYSPWTQVLRTLVRVRGPAIVENVAERLAGLLPELRPDAAAPVGLSDGARYALFEAVADVLRAAAPLLVVLDDLHAAGHPSALLLQFLARELRSDPLALLATYRPVEAGLDEGIAEVVATLEKQAVVLPLAGLAPDEVDELVAHTAGFAPDADLAAAIRLRTEGNPLFVGEVARLIAAGGTDAQQWPVPVGIRQALRVRIDRSDPTLLGAAAVLGRRFDVMTLARIVDAHVTDVAARLDEAVPAGLAVPDGPGHFRFTHDLVRETAYSNLPPRERARLHAAGVTALGERGATDPAAHLSLLAHHALAAVPVLDGGVAAVHARRAGAQAMRVYAFDEAARVFEGGLAALDAAAAEDGALRCAVLLDLAEARV
jgi:predicted ATPase